MDQKRNTENEKMDDFLLPGFRFHPTDEELVGFYLRRKIMQKPLSIELIKQLDIYKFDPWDLPEMASTGEKEWYFYCPRDRKYRNSARPNRVTGAGFWKATGTDRPIYSSEGSKCIGLKKSLVFYKGRAAKGIKTDWMMHEFRLPSSVSDSVKPNNKYLDKNIPANEAWAICRIFKKANSSTQRARSHSWVYPVFDITTSDHHTNTNSSAVENVGFSSSNTIITSSYPNKVANSPLRFGFRDNIQQSTSTPGFLTLQHYPPTKPLYDPTSENNKNNNNNNPFQVYTNGVQCAQRSGPAHKSVFNDASSLLQDMSTSIFGEFARDVDNYMGTTTGFPTGNNLQENICNADLHEKVLVSDQRINDARRLLQDDDECGIVRSSMGSSYNFPMSLSEDGWKSNLMWDFLPHCPSEMSTSYNDSININNCST
ncbi:hypothetical protein OROGR_002084 [Orobanche gracilis]